MPNAWAIRCDGAWLVASQPKTTSADEKVRRHFPAFVDAWDELLKLPEADAAKCVVVPVKVKAKDDVS